MATAPSSPPPPSSSSNGGGVGAAVIDLHSEQVLIDEWRAQRVARLTSETGWLTLCALHWFKEEEGDNTWGSDPSSNTLVLANPSLPKRCGNFLVTRSSTTDNNNNNNNKKKVVRFIAAPGSNVTTTTTPTTVVKEMDLVSDVPGPATLLACGALRFFVIDRSGQLGLRVRDLNHPLRTSFKGCDSFPVSTAWVFDARFEPYQPAHRVKVLNIIGLTEEYECPGAVVFMKDGREWRLDPVLEDPKDQNLFIMLSDATSGHETYGAGRYLYCPLPVNGRTRLDFNKAYNPPCAFSDFATCPRPPPQNQLKQLRIEAGEKTFGQHH